MRKLLFILPLALFTACGSLWELRELEEFAGFTWKADNTLNLNGEISAAGKYDIYILFRHVEGFGLSEMPVHLKLTAGESNIDSDVIVPVRDANGDYLGDGSVDIWDVEYLAFPAQNLPAGPMNIELSQGLGKDGRLIMEAGVMIKKAASE